MFLLVYALYIIIECMNKMYKKDYTILLFGIYMQEYMNMYITKNKNINIVEHFVRNDNSLVLPESSVSVESLLDSGLSQKNLSSRIDGHQFDQLYLASSPANCARLLSVSSHHASSWLAVIPSKGLNLSGARRVSGCLKMVAWDGHITTGTLLLLP